METTEFVYATFIRTTPEKLWEALTNGNFSEKYWFGFRVEFELKAGGTVRISGIRENGCLCICVYNDAPDSPIDWSLPKTGVGLSNLRARLKILHGDAAQLELNPADSGGLEVVVQLPFKA